MQPEPEFKSHRTRCQTRAGVATHGTPGGEVPDWYELWFLRTYFRLNRPPSSQPEGTAGAIPNSVRIANRAADAIP